MLLTEWLKSNQVKRVDFAKRIGRTPSYVTGICKGDFWPSRDVVNLIAEVTGGEVTANDFTALGKEAV